MSSGTESEEEKYWVDWFLSLKGNEYFCEVDQDYIADRFNLTGLHAEVPFYSQALNLILDQMDDDLDEATRVEVEKSARNLYGLIHARFIITSRGLAKMLEKYKQSAFGSCPRVLCQGQPLLPVGMTDIPYQKAVKLYCCRCEDVYNPRSSRYQYMDGAFFGSTFPHMLLQVYPNAVPVKANDRYVPRIFGFKIHDITKCMIPATSTGNEQNSMNSDNINTTYNGNNNNMDDGNSYNGSISRPTTATSSLAASALLK